MTILWNRSPRSAIVAAEMMTCIARRPKVSRRERVSEGEIGSTAKAVAEALGVTFSGRDRNYRQAPFRLPRSRNSSGHNQHGHAEG